MNKTKLISKFLGFSILILISFFVPPVWGYEDPFEPGSYFNPYIIKKRPFSNEYEMRPKYPTFNRNPLAPGSYFNPYIIKKRPFSDDEYEVRPKYPTFGY
jgi:hypothetical protein